MRSSKNMFKDYDLSSNGKYLNIKNSNQNSYNLSQSHNSFKTVKQTNSSKTDKTINSSHVIDMNDTELFPVLVSTKQATNTNSVPNFKDVLNNKESNDNTTSKPSTCLEDGYMEIFIDDKGNTVYKYGNPTPYIIKQQIRNKLKNTPNYIMEQIISELNKNTQKYIDIYDSIHGEGAYDEKYQSILSQDYNYDTEYSYDSESNDDLTEDDY